MRFGSRSDLPAGAAGGDRTWAVIAGGGTAGHVLPGLSIAAEIVSRGAARSAVHCVGSRRGIESRLVPAAGFGLTLLGGRGIVRGFGPADWVANTKACGGLIGALWRGFGILRRHRPAVVVGLGGYASVPCALAAIVKRVPLVLAEQNAVPGAANRILSRFARAVAVAWPATRLERAVWTGNPVRAEIAAVDRGRRRVSARQQLGVADDRCLIVVFGGSLGARSINQALLDALPIWRERSDLQVRHITGRRDHTWVSEQAAQLRGASPACDLVEYEDDMATVYAAADLIVARAGATSVAELAAVGVPAILVPLPGAPGDHQTANAGALVAAGAAVLVPDGELDGARLARETDSLIMDPERRRAMERAGRSLGRGDAAGAVVDLIEAHASRELPRNSPTGASTTGEAS